MDVASALELVADILDVAMMLPIAPDASGGLGDPAPAQHPVADDIAQLANLGDLVGDTQQYLLGLTTGSRVRADIPGLVGGHPRGVGVPWGSFPPAATHGHNQTSFRSEVLYGWTAASATDHPNLVELLCRTMTWRLDGQVAGAPPAPGTEEIVDLTFALVPPEHNQGSWGLFVRLAGATALTFPLGTPKRQPDGRRATGWQLAVASTDAVALEMLFGGNGFMPRRGSGYQGQRRAGAPGRHQRLMGHRVDDRQVARRDPARPGRLSRSARTTRARCSTSARTPTTSSSISRSAATRSSARCCRPRCASTPSSGWAWTPAAASTSTAAWRSSSTCPST